MMDISLERVDAFECEVCSHRVAAEGRDPFARIACPRCDSEVIVPARFGQFLLLEKLGEGVIGSVFRALDLALNRQIALKVMHKVLTLNPRLVEAFRLQAASAATLLHPHIITIYAFGSHRDHAHISMELIRGRNLHELLAGGSIEERDLLEVAFRVSEALQYAAAQGMIHGDVRPRNVFIDHEGKPKIGEFGIAQAMAGAGFRDLVWSSPYYTPPERADDRPPDLRGDIYSLGATLYHALCGRPPFDHPDPEAVRRMKQTQPVPDIRGLDASIHARTATILGRMLEHNPARRYPNHDSLQADLAEAIQEVDAEPGTVLPPPLPKSPAARAPSGETPSANKKPSQKMPSQKVSSQKLASQKLSSQKLKSQKLLSLPGHPAPGGAEHPGATGRPGAGARPRPKSAPVLLAGAFCLLAAGVAAFFLLRDPPQPPPAPEKPSAVWPGFTRAKPVEEQLSSAPSLLVWAATEIDAPALDGDPIARWTNRRDNSRAGVQAAPALRPILKRDVLAGRPVLRFNNAQMRFDLPGEFHQGSIFLVLRLDPYAGSPDGNSVNRCLLAIGPPEHPEALLGILSRSTEPSSLLLNALSSETPHPIERTGADRRWVILEANLEAAPAQTLFTFAVNGSLAFNDILPRPSLPGGPVALWLGGHPLTPNAMTGQVAELLVFSPPLSPSERKVVGEHLARRHALPSAYSSAPK